MHPHPHNIAKWVAVKEFSRDGVIVKVERLDLDPPRYSFTIGTQNGLRFTPHLYPVKQGDQQLGWIVASLIDDACAFVDAESAQSSSKQSNKTK